MDKIVLNLPNEDTSRCLHSCLCSKNASVHAGIRVKPHECNDTSKVAAVATGKCTIDANLLLMTMDIRTTIALVRDVGLEIGEVRATKVNERFQTSRSEIYAYGDRVENSNTPTSKLSYAPLSSTANKHGKVIGDSATGSDSEFAGALGTITFKAVDFNAGRIGLSENDCLGLGIPVVVR